MTGKLYSSSDAWVIAFIRQQGVDAVDVFPDPENPRRMRVSVDLSDAEGRKKEVEYRNSDFRRFALEYNDTVDLLKRR